MSCDAVQRQGIISALGIWRLRQVGDVAETMVKRVLVKERIAAGQLV